MTDTETSDTEHRINVKSVQVWRGEFDSEFLTDDGLSPDAIDLGFEEEVTLTFDCECGDRFRKWDTAAQHLRDNRPDSTATTQGECDAS